MRARLLPLLVLLPALAAASAPVRPAAEPVDIALQRARAEAAEAEARMRSLESAAREARDEAARLRARQAAAAQAIAAAEARISATDAEVRLIAATTAMRADKLRRAQQPVSSLLAGLAMMARRPPLLTILDSGSAEEFVRVRLLLDATMPVIRQRTAALSGALRQGRILEAATRRAQADLQANRATLARRRDRFAQLEAQASAAALSRGIGAIGAGDQAIATLDVAERLASEAERERYTRRIARELAAAGPAPSGLPLDRARAGPLAYVLPADAPVREGLGEVSNSGIRARGLTLATWRGAPVLAPATGTVRFAGPFRRHDGIVIIDHGGGWLSLLVNLSTQLRPGARVAAGQPLGRALGPLGVELSRHGQHHSPALIAGSSAPLSKTAKGS